MTDAQYDALMAKLDLVLTLLTQRPAQVERVSAEPSLPPKVQAALVRRGVGLPRETVRRMRTEAAALILEGRSADEVARMVMDGISASAPQVQSVTSSL